jgi:hypothetical protein
VPISLILPNNSPTLFISVKYIPTWFPGAGFKREAISISKDVEAMLTAPFEMVKNQMVRLVDDNIEFRWI